MSRTRLAMASAGLLGGVGIAGLWILLPAQAEPPAGVQAVAKSAADNPEAAIKAITAEYVRAFNAADAKAAAALWTAEGEFVGPDGESVRGRAAIEKSLADAFKAHPKATIEARVTGVRLLGRHTAVAEGTVTFRAPQQAEATETRYSALTVLEDGQWRVASVREWNAEPGASESAKHLDFLAGEWTATGDRGTLTISYTWDEKKAFLYGRYTIAKDGTTMTTGMQVIGVNPGGGLRSCLFDSSGATNTAVWDRDGDRWVERTTGTLPDGRELLSVNVLIPLGPDAFSWQPAERAIDGVPLAPLPPLKVTRVKKG